MLVHKPLTEVLATSHRMPQFVKKGVFDQLYGWVLDNRYKPVIAIGIGVMEI